MKYIRILKRVLKFAIDQGWLETNPVGRFKCTYVEPFHERLTMEEVMTVANRFLYILASYIITNGKYSPSLSNAP